MKFRDRSKITVIIPVLIVILIAILSIKNPPVIDDYIEGLLVDYRFKVRNLISEPEAPENIVIVTVDEKSLQEYGRWPWNRGLQAELVEKIFSGEPAQVGIDIFYPEKESEESDRLLASVFSRHRSRLVTALGFEAEAGKRYGGEIEDILYYYAFTSIENYRLLKAVEAFRVLLPPEPIRSSTDYGHVYSLPDMDGKLRWEYLYVRYGDEYFPSLSLQVAARMMNVPFAKLKIIGGIGVEAGALFIPTDEFGRLHINYYGKEGSFTYYPAADILSGRVGPSIFKDKIVLLGTSAMSTYDMKITPFSANMPGVEKHATIIANILNRDFIRRPPLYVDLIILIISGILAIAVGNVKRALHSFILYDLLLLIMLISNQVAFSVYGLRLNLIYPTLTLLASGIFTISYRYLNEERKAREIRRMFSSYVTERVVNELIRNPEMAKLGGERRNITVLFSDVCGFTSYSEKHEPEEVVNVLNEYLSAMTEVIFRWEGTLDKFIGDAIVAFWGAPLEQKNHAELAVRCALHMIKRLEELREKWIREGRAPLSMGIGLNTGEVLVGNIGAEGKKMDYTVIGDHVNIGARVEALTRKFNTDILMTELPLNEIRKLVETSRIGHISVRGVGTVVVKGKEKPVRIYEIKSLPPSESSVIEECPEEEVIRMKEK
jgi:adenylate cyclase